MRRTILLTMFFALAVPAAGLGLPAGDGTLAIRNADGGVTLNVVRGTVIGKFDAGALTVLLPAGETSCASVAVWGNEGERFIDDGEVVRCVFSGTNVRFRLIGGSHRIAINRGRDIDASVVGRGTGTLRGTRGQYSLDGSPYEALVDGPVRFVLGS